MDKVEGNNGYHIQWQVMQTTQPKYITAMKQSFKLSTRLKQFEQEKALI